MYISSLSLFADLFYYIIGIAAAVALRKNRADLHRPYMAPAIKAGAFISIVIYFIMMTQLQRDAVIFGIIWNILGLVIYNIYSRPQTPEEIRLKRKEQSVAINSIPLPTPEEKKNLDREFNVWKTVVAAVCILASLLYAVPYIF